MLTRFIATLAAGAMLLTLGLSAFADDETSSGRDDTHQEQMDIAPLPIAQDAAPIVVAPAPAASVTASAHPVLDLANPNAGDVLLYGDYIVSGMAFDPAATNGAGVSEVDFFLGNRDAGGLYLGCAHPGVDLMPGVTPGSRLAQGGFQVKITLPANISGGQDFYAYATSVTGQETVTWVPVYVGAAPTPTPRPTTSN